jgi:hypothetical protein
MEKVEVTGSLNTELEQVRKNVEKILALVFSK